MSSIPNSLRQQVIDRANSRFEYCLLHQDYSIYTHEVDHIIALKHSGQTIADNLALSCLSCNRHKGSDFATIDPSSGEIIPLFNPRRQVWEEHFAIANGRVDGISPIGEATARLLAFNSPKRILERRLLMQQGCYP